MKIRHSSLPKLALCGQYEVAPGTSPAAERGTMLDQVFRNAWTTGELPWDLSDEDTAAIKWALSQCIQLGGGAAGLTTEPNKCWVFTPGLNHRGAVDGVAVRGGFSIDLKSGQVYDYTAQMAAYALGLMTEHGKEEWQTHLLFCDQRKLVSTSWTRGSARAVVETVLANVGTPPKENDYCGWCAKSLTCPGRVQSQALVLQTTEHAITPQDGSFLALLDDPVAIGLFLRQCATLEHFKEAAKEKARQLLEGGFNVPGWRLQKPRVSETVEAEHLAQAVRNGVIGADNAILAQSAINLKKAQALWSAAGAVLPEEIVQRKVGQAPLVQAK
jgi:hypothetical protein